ncbi:MAG: slipin family protein [Ktedonobacterales bacterium]|jgi:regulator of protease activity HflC (stomatin/prohibitin superfamily)|nr:MAG: slipin family protein [Ktedonobacterales bacterium]
MTNIDSTALVIGGLIILGILILFVLAGLRVVNQYERGVIFVLGRLIGAKGPGLFWVPPFISSMRKIDLRVVTIELPPQEGVTRDNVTVKVSAVVYFYVVNPRDAVNNVLDYYRATVQIAQTTLRSVIGQSTLDQLLTDREDINRNVQKIIDEHTERWGIKVTTVEIKDVELPVTMQRAMAKQAEAEREKRAKVLLAQGEYQAAQTLADAAHLISTEPAALQLRYLQALTEIAVEKNSTIIFPLPIDLVEPLMELMRRASGGPGEAKTPARVTVPGETIPPLQ